MEQVRDDEKIFFLAQKLGLKAQKQLSQAQTLSLAQSLSLAQISLKKTRLKFLSLKPQFLSQNKTPAGFLVFGFWFLDTILSPCGGHPFTGKDLGYMPQHSLLSSGQ